MGRFTKDDATPEERHVVQEELEELRQVASTTSTAEIKDGRWFAALLRHALDTYTREVNAGFFQRKYPGIPADAIVDRRIALAQRYAMIEGGLSASAYTAAVAATIGSGGGASPLTIPGAVVSFTVDLLYVTRLQLRLAYDLAVLYRHPIDVNDPEDLYDLLRVAFGIKVGETLRGALPRLAPDAARAGVKAVVKGPVLAFLQQLPVIGRHLLQRNIIKFAVPAVGIPLSMGLNRYMTGQVGQQGRAIYRDKASILKAAAAMAGRFERVPSLLLRAIWMVVYADRKIEAEESWLLKALVAELSQKPDAAEALEEFKGILDLDHEAFYSDLAELPPDVRGQIFEAACNAAFVDHDLGADEVVVLRELAAKCDMPFDPKALKARAKQGLNSRGIT